MIGYRKILTGMIFLASAIVILFLVDDIDKLKAFFEFITWLAGIVIAGNGLEWIGGRVMNGKPEAAVLSSWRVPRGNNPE